MKPAFLALLVLFLLCPPAAGAGERNAVQKNIQSRVKSDKPAKPAATLNTSVQGLSTGPINVNLTPPKVKSVYPLNGATTTVGEEIRVLFSQKMDLESLKKAVSFVGWFGISKEIPVDIEPASPDGREFLIKPSETLKPKIAYIVKIKGSEAKNVNGTAMADDYDWNFSIEVNLAKLAKLEVCASFYAKMEAFASEMQGNVPKWYPSADMVCTPFGREFYNVGFNPSFYPAIEGLTDTSLKKDLTDCSNFSPTPDPIEGVFGCRNPSAEAMKEWYYFDFDNAHIMSAPAAPPPGYEETVFLVCIRKDGKSNTMFPLWKSSCSP